MNFSFNANATFTNNEIDQDNVLVHLPPTVSVVNGKSDTINTTRTDTYYVNLDGDAHAYVGRYNIAKQLDDRKYNLIVKR